jgi:hypothetical protein
VELSPWYLSLVQSLKISFTSHILHFDLMLSHNVSLLISNFFVFEIMSYYDVIRLWPFRPCSYESTHSLTGFRLKSP